MSDADMPKWEAIPLDAERNWRNASCYHCDKASVSAEHLPPDNLFATVTKSMPMLTVPACRDHNNSFSNDDEWFRSIIVPYCTPASAVANDLMQGKVQRANSRKPSIGKVDYDENESLDVWTPSGIYGGKRVARFTFSPTERGCMVNMFNRISRAIYWQYTGRATASCIIKLLDNALPWEQSFIQDCMPGFRLAQMFGVGHPDVFQFKAIGLGKDVESLIVWSCFFGKLSMVSIIRHPNIIK